MHFGAALRLMRMDKGLALGELARRIGVSAAYLSRVEHGHDAAPTPDRLAAIARELDLPALVLIELADQTGTALSGYLQRVPAAVPLFLDIARRSLNLAELARVQDFVTNSFPDKRRGGVRPLRLSDLLAPESIVVGVTGSGLDDALEVAVMGWDLGDRLTGQVVVEAMLERERQASSAIGAGVIVPHAVLKGAPLRAALVTLDRALAMSSPDNVAVRVAVVLLLPSSGRKQLELVAHVARLASRGLADTIAGIRTPARVLAHIAALEAL